MRSFRAALTIRVGTFAFLVMLFLGVATVAALHGLLHQQLDPQAWPVLRRFIAEARDRVFPYVPASIRRRPPAYRAATAVAPGVRRSATPSNTPSPARRIRFGHA